VIKWEMPRGHYRAARVPGLGSGSLSRSSIWGVGECKRGLGGGVITTSLSPPRPHHDALAQPGVLTSFEIPLLFSVSPSGLTGTARLLNETISEDGGAQLLNIPYGFLGPPP